MFRSVWNRLGQSSPVSTRFCQAVHTLPGGGRRYGGTSAERTYQLQTATTTAT